MPPKPARKSKTRQPETPPLSGIVMGSQSDWETMQNAADVLDGFGIPYEANIVSAHRTPQRLYDYAANAAERGLRIIIAGAGGAAHLPGMVASLTTLPVFGVPVRSTSLDGIDSLLSIAQMPAGIPVGTLAIGNAGATNAGLLAVSVLSLQSPELAEKLREFRAEQTASIAEKPVKAAKKKGRA
jgi:5-(carboxyamino)imidazole ribonucleotide mutase